MKKYFTLSGRDCKIRCKLYYTPGTITNRDPEVPAAAAQLHHVILFCHGFAGHKDNAAAEKLAGRILEKHTDTALLIFNWPGHGDDEHDTLFLGDCDLYLSTVLDYIRTALKPELLDVCATSFGGYLVLKYISDHRESPFRRICLRCPAVVMEDILTKTILTPEELAVIDAGGSVPAGFDRKVLITGAFLESLRQADLVHRDLRPYSGRICIVQGTADEIVPCSAVHAFAKRNRLRLLSVESADHRFLDPAKMETVLNTFMEFLF